MAQCKATEGCNKDAKKLGFCNTHYMQVQRGTRHVDGQLLAVDFLGDDGASGVVFKWHGEVAFFTVIRPRAEVSHPARCALVQ